jgi:drug/metabolite transporter (DMT)-like permease
VNRRKAEAALVLNTVVWGATFVLVKAALADVTPLLFLALRFSLATGALLALFSGSRRVPFTGKAAAAGALAGIFLFSGYLFQTLGLPRSAFITGLSSVMVPLLAALVYRNRPQVSEVAGVLVATAGLGLMTLRSAGAGAGGSISRGDLLTFFCAIGFAAHIVTLGHFSENMRFQLLSVAQIGAAAVLALSSFWWAEAPPVIP